MPIEIQNKLKENKLYKAYLRSNSYWYKKLIRNPELFNEFKEEMRVQYKMRTIDKVNKTLDVFTMISNIFSNMV